MISRHYNLLNKITKSGRRLIIARRDDLSNGLLERGNLLFVSAQNGRVQGYDFHRLRRCRELRFYLLLFGGKFPLSSPQPTAPNMPAEPRWTAERVAFICEQYLSKRKSAGEIAKMLGPAFSRNAVTGKLYRIGALRARSGVGLSKSHGLPRGNNFCPGRKQRKKPIEIDQTSKRDVQKVIAAAPPLSDDRDGKAFLRRTEALFDIPGIPLLDAHPKHCRWPAKPEGSLAHVCGAAVAHGSYCAFHAAIAYRSKPINCPRTSEL